MEDLLAVLPTGSSWTMDDGYTVTNTGVLDLYIVKSAFDIPVGSYNPSDLGLDLPLCQKINVGICPHTVIRHKVGFWKWLFTGQMYKTSIGALKIDYGSHSWGPAVGHVSSIAPTEMCVINGKHVLMSEGVPTETVLHEYAHIMVGVKEAHGPVWAEAARKLGLVESTSTNIFRV